MKMSPYDASLVMKSGSHRKLAGMETDIFQQKHLEQACSSCTNLILRLEKKLVQLSDHTPDCELKCAAARVCDFCS